MSESYIVFTGRPNAGKSSIIRALTGLKLAIGKKPGTTTKINKYNISKDLYLVDMPGYGVKVNATKYWEDKTKDNILDFIERNANNIITAVHVLNIITFIETEERLSKKGFISIDVEMINYLRDNIGQYPFVAANKIDRGSEKQVMENLNALIFSLTGGQSMNTIKNIYPVSAKKGIGIGELKNQLVAKLFRAGFQNPFDYIR